jgi:hypothetical protein
VRFGLYKKRSLFAGENAMSLIINGRQYADIDPVTWEDAVEAGGFYYSRACFLGLPNPPAVLFTERKDNNTLQAFARYHDLFREAEAKSVQETHETEDREIFREVAATNLQLVADRLRELANPNPGTPVFSVKVDAAELEALAEMLTSVRAGL